MVTPAARREAVAHLRLAYEVSERRACSALGAERTSVRYRSIRPDDGAPRARLRELALVRRRFGYRRLHILLRREGIAMNHKKLRRLYREERLQVRRRNGRKRALGARAPMALPQGADQRWSLDFVSDAFTDGRRFRWFWPARRASSTLRGSARRRSGICGISLHSSYVRPSRAAYPVDSGSSIYSGYAGFSKLSSGMRSPGGGSRSCIETRTSSSARTATRIVATTLLETFSLSPASFSKS